MDSSFSHNIQGSFFFFCKYKRIQIISSLILKSSIFISTMKIKYIFIKIIQAIWKTLKYLSRWLMKHFHHSGKEMKKKSNMIYLKI